MNITVPLGRTVNVLWKQRCIKYGTLAETDIPLVGNRRGSSSTEIVSVNVLVAWNVTDVQQSVASEMGH